MLKKLQHQSHAAHDLWIDLLSMFIWDWGHGAAERSRRCDCWLPGVSSVRLVFSNHLKWLLLSKGWQILLADVLIICLGLSGLSGMFSSHLIQVTGDWGSADGSVQSVQSIRHQVRCHDCKFGQWAAAEGVMKMPGVLVGDLCSNIMLAKEGIGAASRPRRWRFDHQALTPGWARSW